MSSMIKPGYTGVSFKNARCLGLMVAKGRMQYHYAHLLGTITAAKVNVLFY